MTERVGAPAMRAWPLLAAAMVLTGTVGSITVRIEGTYLQNFPYFYDPVFVGISFRSPDGDGAVEGFGRRCRG